MARKYSGQFSFVQFKVDDYDDRGWPNNEADP